jgi:hypothetical protein
MTNLNYISFLTRIALISLEILIAGCVSITQVPMNEGIRSHVYEKNYTIGVSKTIYIGDALISVNDYYELQQSTPILVSSNAYRIFGGEFGASIEYSGPMGDKLELRGQFDDDYVMVLPQVPLVGLLVAKSGTFLGSAVNLTGYTTLIYTYKIDPPTTQFTLDSAKSVDTSAGFINYEIVYTGRSSESLNFLYREYTPDNIARVPFYQNLMYPTTSHVIRFKNLRIRIDNITDEGITFTVLQDE